MQYKITVILLLSMAGVISGCSTAQVDNALASAAGNNAPYRFYFTAPEKVERWYFSDANYKALPPRTYVKDWSKMAGWRGVEDVQGSMLALYMKEHPGFLNYAISISSYTGKYGIEEQAIERKDIRYLNIVKQKFNFPKNAKLYYATYGKEKYTCLVKVVKTKNNELLGEEKEVYYCYKFNPSRSMFKTVVLKLIYTKTPKLPKKYKHLANEYTFGDLKRRAKRTLDSLYIKDGWN